MENLSEIFLAYIKKVAVPLHPPNLLRYEQEGRDDLWMATDAMTWAFSDEDAKEGKIFRYIKSVA